VESVRRTANRLLADAMKVAAVRCINGCGNPLQRRAVAFVFSTEEHEAKGFIRRPGGAAGRRTSVNALLEFEPGLHGRAIKTGRLLQQHLEQGKAQVGRHMRAAPHMPQAQLRCNRAEMQRTSVEGNERLHACGAGKPRSCVLIFPIGKSRPSRVPPANSLSADVPFHGAVRACDT
jgi:hypothetical protein